MMRSYRKRLKRVLPVSLLTPLAMGVLARAQADAAQAQTGDAMGQWATAAFVWLILILAMGFVVAMGWLSRSRR